ncbi:MAG: FtsX-like permease family protein, partial [Acidimicrobiia bacterium]
MLRTPPFRRAPKLLFKRKAVLFSVMGAATILAMVAALTPLFLSSAASAALQRELEGRCDASFGGQTINFAPLDVARSALTEVVAQDPNLGTPRLFLEGTIVEARNQSGEGLQIPVRVVARDEFEQHLTRVSGSHGDGADRDHIAAEQMQLGPGDTLEFLVHGEQTIPVVAVYEGLAGSGGDDYWCSIEEITRPDVKGDLPPPLVLVQTDQFRDQPEIFNSVYAQYARSLGDWEIPIDTSSLTVDGADSAAETLASADEIIEENSDGIPAFFGRPNLLTDLPLVTNRVAALSESLRTSILPLAGVVLLAAVALVGGAGSYWVDRRKTELQYLSAMGAGPGLLAVKAILEFLPAMLAGGALGWGIANLLVGVIGPSADIEPASRVDAIWVASAAIASGLVAVWVVVALRARTLLDQHQRKASRFPWRIPALILSVLGAFWVRSRIGDSAVTVEENQLVGSVDPLVLFFPLFVFLAVVLLIAELVIRSFPLLKRAGGSNHSTYLATRRIISAPTLVVALIAGAALPIATLVYAASLTRSATSTIEAKGRSFIGADVSTPVFGLIDPPGHIEDVSTVVVKVERADLNGTTVDLLAVDRTTFAQGAFWDESFSDTPLDEVLDTLAGDGIGAPLPAFVANGTAGDGELQSAAGDVQVFIQGEIDSFPGVRRSRPLVIVDRQRLVEAIGTDGKVRGSRYLMWSMERTEIEVEQAMAAGGVGFAYTVAAATTLDQLKFAAVVWTFDFLEIYAALAGLIAIGAVLLYVDTRQRQRNLSYALARRMGLRRSEHLWASFIELSSLSALGALAGILAARIAARSLYAVLDAVPETPPGPRWIGALDLALVAIVVALAVAAIGAFLAQNTADNADTSELLRHGD